jgi:hypothetical protein
MRELTPTIADRLTELTGKKHAAAANSWSERRHLLDTRDLTKAEISCFLDVAAACKMAHESEPPLSVLHGKTVANIF